MEGVEQEPLTQRRQHPEGRNPRVATPSEDESSVKGRDERRSPIVLVFFSRLSETFFIFQLYWLNSDVKLVGSLAIQTVNSGLGLESLQSCNLHVFWSNYQASKHALNGSYLV